MRFPQTWNAWTFAMLKNVIHSQLLKPIFFPEPMWNSDNQKLSNFKTDFFYRSVILPFAVQLFSLPFNSHCSTQNIGFNNSGYVIKPPQPSSAIYGALPRTPELSMDQDWIGPDQDWSQFWPDQDWIGLRKFLLF